MWPMVHCPCSRGRCFIPTPTWAAVISGQMRTSRPSFWFLQTGSHSVVLADLELTDTPRICLQRTGIRDVPPCLASPNFFPWVLGLRLLTDLTPQTQPFPHSNQRQGTLSLPSSRFALQLAFGGSSLSLPTLVCLGVLRIV